MILLQDHLLDRSRIRYLCKKIVNFHEFSEIKKNLYKNWLNVRVGVAFQSLMRFTVSC